ncbi:hypothetical protein PhCBS80983_g02368 [Powellomyces hirtus]|uniref:non-specific serine/threonine protein kinase n=1 Tax=Powellomyces hirtus TaxID=109895 RepID=A0A507E7B7_9FUNG|nr:hypothetical protein PhCBS80983_g02368 [Powellomyces hirtus]
MSDPQYNRAPAASNICGGPHDDDDDEEHRVIETDPTGRFERYAECLGKGAYKEVFKGFDTEEGMEVAWNQLRVDHLLKREAQRILGEIQILQTLSNDNIINLYYSWIAKGRDGKEKVFFITELMMSGTLKNYIRKTKGPVKPKVLRNWCRQILTGLDYLHTREPPIIHRDLKCDNIFINGNNGQAKIGDLGLAVVRHRDHVSSVLGTPEFMAPELYDENYNEKVDIYAFGMMVLEIATKEYPYSECTNQAQIYKKVSSGIKPAALAKVQDDETREFINHCIQFNPRQRPTAGELLRHPFVLPALHSSTALFVGADGTHRPEGSLSHRGSLTSEPRGSVTSTASSLETPVTGDSALGGAWLSDRSQGALPFQQPGLTEPVRVDAETHTFEILKRHAPGIPAVHSTYPLPSSATSNSSLPRSLCSVEIVEKLNDTQVLVKMIYGTSNRAAQEIKFPFHYGDDTSDLVVDEMVKEGIIDAQDQELAVERLESVVRGSERGSSFERGQSGEKFNGYPAVAQSPPASPATFPRYRNPQDVGTVRSATMPRGVSGWGSTTGSFDHPQGPVSRQQSPVMTAQTLPRMSPSAGSPGMPRSPLHQASGVSIAELVNWSNGPAPMPPFSLPPSHTITISSIESALSSSAPASASTSASRPTTPDGARIQGSSGEGGISLPIPSVVSQSVPGQQQWIITEQGMPVAPTMAHPHSAAPHLRVDPDLHRKLLEMQERNLRGFGSLSLQSTPRTTPTAATPAELPQHATSSRPTLAPQHQHSTSLPYGYGGSTSTGTSVANHFVTLGQMQQQGVGVGQQSNLARPLPLTSPGSLGNVNAFFSSSAGAAGAGPVSVPNREYKSLPRTITPTANFTSNLSISNIIAGKSLPIPIPPSKAGIIIPPTNGARPPPPAPPSKGDRGSITAAAPAPAAAPTCGDQDDDCELMILATTTRSALQQKQQPAKSAAVNLMD